MSRRRTVVLGSLALLVGASWVYLTASSGIHRENMQAFCKGLSTGMALSEIQSAAETRDYMYRRPSLGGRIPGVLIDRNAIGFRCELHLDGERLVSAQYLEGSR
jgi:hypothetical protein